MRSRSSHFVVFAAGIGVGAGAMLVAFPFLFPPPPAAEPAPMAAVSAPVAAAAITSPKSQPKAGHQAQPQAQPQAAAAPALSQQRVFQFDEKAPGRDPIHWANGNGRILKTEQGWVLRLESDFETGPGPNFWIYLNTRSVGDERDFRADGQRVKLAQLRSFRGAQNYALPPDFDPSRWHTVTVWCETFGVYIGSGALQAPVAASVPTIGTVAHDPPPA